MFLAAVLVTMAASAENELISASWNLIGDSTTTCTEFGYQQSLAKGDTLQQNGINLFYIQGEKAYEPSINKNLGNGAYWHNSDSEKGDNVIALTVPGNSKCIITLKLRPGKKNVEYIFYAFAQNANGNKPAELYNNTANAVASSKWQLNDYTEGSTELTFDFMEKENYQDIYIIYTSSTGLRHRGVSYQMTEKKGSTTTSAEEAIIAGKVARKMIINGQLVIVRDGVEYNALGVIR